MSKDRIEESAVLPAPLERAWHSVADAQKFGEWFGAEFDGPFRAGERITGRIRPTRMDPAIAKLQEPYSGTPMELFVEAIEEHRRIVFGWHPYAIDKSVDYSAEPMTRIEFRLEEADKGTRCTIVESGFDALPAGRRDAAYKANAGGWELQMRLLYKYVNVSAG